MFMTRIRGVLTVVLVLGLALGGSRVGVGLPTSPVAMAQEKTGDQALDGLWEDVGNKGGWLRFDGSTINYHPPGKSDEIIEWTCRYNLTLTPMTIDIFQKGATSHGILVGERGTLFIALAKPGEERPTRFVRDEATRLFVLKRKTAEEKEKPKTEGKVPDGDQAAQPNTPRASSGKKTDAETIARLIKQLGDDDFERREAASKELDSIGDVGRRHLEGDLQWQRRGREAMGSSRGEGTESASRARGRGDVRRIFLGWEGIGVRELGQDRQGVEPGHRTSPNSSWAHEPGLGRGLLSPPRRPTRR
jgi:hypothetical protein